MGRVAIIAAMKEGKQLDRIYMQTAVHGDTIDEIRILAERYKIPINKVPVEKLNKAEDTKRGNKIKISGAIQHRRFVVLSLCMQPFGA